MMVGLGGEVTRKLDPAVHLILRDIRTMLTSCCSLEPAFKRAVREVLVIAWHGETSSDPRQGGTGAKWSM